MRFVSIPQTISKSRSVLDSGHAPALVASVKEQSASYLVAQVDLHRLIEDAYARALDTHGDLGLSFESYATRLMSVTSACIGRCGAPQQEAHDPGASITRLHTNDMYLSLACVQGSEAGWNRFVACYRRYIQDLVRRFCQTIDPAETCDAILADLCLRDRSGRPRIESYDCKYSLATWLRAIVDHRMINELKRKSVAGEASGSITDVADDSALERVEAAVREGRYAEMIRDSFKDAIASLTDREALILLMVYNDGLTQSQVAARLGVHRSTVSHLERRILDGLRGKFMSVLEVKYHLSQAAVEECIAEAITNPAYSITALLKRQNKE